MNRNEILNQVKRDIEPQVLEGYFDQILISRVVDATLKTINYSQCCKSDSEQLVCPECKSTDCKTATHTDYKECNKCYHYWEAN